MLKGLFKKTPTVEEFRQIVFQSLDAKGIEIPKDITIHEEIDGFKYKQRWEMEQEQIVGVVLCNDIRKSNEPIQFINGLS